MEESIELPRRLPPKTLYHYCSNVSFLSILQNRELVASGLTLSNDTMEGKWIERVFSDLLREDDELRQHLEKLIPILEFTTGVMGGLGFCLSEDGDLLSQWRGYADNAAGVSIGFESVELSRLGTVEKGGKLAEVIYDFAAQKAELAPLITRIKKLVADGALRPMAGTFLAPTTKEQAEKIHQASNSLWFSFMSAFPHIFSFKNPAFREEREWRFLSYLVNGDAETSIDIMQFTDFRAKHDRIVPFQRFAFGESKQPLITKVILGPRNITPDTIVSGLLKKNGFVGVEVSRSASTYR